MKKYIAETVGTFVLVFCGTAAIISNEVSGGAVQQVGIAATFGLAVLAMIYAVGDISGAHLNPAVTISFAVANRFEWKQVLPYCLSQVIGALLASFVLRVLFPDNQMLGSTHPSGAAAQSFLMEFILTFMLMFVILKVSTGAKEKGITAGIAIGSVIGMEAMFGGPISGASMNPARSLAPALVSGYFEHLWLYIIAPVAGALFATLVNKFTNYEDTKQ